MVHSINSHSEIPHEFDCTDEATIALNVTRSIARNYDHREADLVHLAYVLFMMDESIGCRVLAKLGQRIPKSVNIDNLKAAIEKIILKRYGCPLRERATPRRNSTDISSTSSDSGSFLGRRLSDNSNGSINTHGTFIGRRFSGGLKASIQRLVSKRPGANIIPLEIELSRSLKMLLFSSEIHLEMPCDLDDDEKISLHYMLLILYEDNQICDLLTRKYGLSKKVVSAALSEIVICEKLDRYSIDLIKLAREGKIEKVGREKEVRDVIKILCCGSRNKVCLSAEPLADTIDVVEGLVLRIIQGNVPDAIGINISVRALDIDALVNGAKGSEEIQGRLQEVFNDVKKLKRNIVFFIDDLHFVLAEETAKGIDSANLLKSMMQNNDIKIIGAIGTEYYTKCIEHDSIFGKSFQRVCVKEIPTKQATFDGEMMARAMYRRQISERYISMPKDTSLNDVVNDCTSVSIQNQENIVSIEHQIFKLQTTLKSLKQTEVASVDEEKEVNMLQLTATIMDASFEPMILFDEKGVIEHVNLSTVTLFGYSSQNEFHEKDIIKTLSCDSIDIGDILPKYETDKFKIEVIGKRKNFDLCLDDSTFPAMFSIAKSSSKYICFVKDLDKDAQHCKTNAMRLFRNAAKTVMKLNQENEEIRRSEQMTKGIIEAASDPLLVTDARGKIQMVNEAAVEKLGFSREEFNEQNLKSIVGLDDDIFHGEDTEIGQYMQRMGKCKESIAIRKDGSEFPIELAVQEVAKSSINEEEGDEHFYVAFVRDLTDQKKMIEMQVEKVATESLILNMLPENVASRLKGDPSECHIADSFSCITILFADIVGFTEMSGRVSPKELVKLLNDLFSRFDDLVDKHNLNKVKTIGDAYMVTSIPSIDHQPHDAPSVCAFALDAMNALISFNCDTGNELDLRIGINTGAVVAGIVGRKRFLYDLWGDAVNIASRMESTGIPGQIQVTKHVVEHADDDFDFEYRGTVKVKGKGDMETYILQKPKSDNFESRHRQRRCSLASDSSSVGSCN